MIILTDNKKLANNLIELSYLQPSSLTNFNGNKDVIALIGSRCFIKTSETLDFPSLKLVQLTSAGFEGIDLPYFKSKNITVCNAANVYSIGMAEFVVYSMLKSAKRYNASICNNHIRYQRNYKYITELADKKVLILGVGGIGSEIAKRLKAFDMSVYGYARRTKMKTNFDRIVHSMYELQDLLSECDYMVSTLPDNTETEKLINQDVLNRMKQDITIVNVGRRKVFDEDDLYSFLKSHRKATAILDMYERFPNPITNCFRRLSNVWVLPGVTAISQEIDERLYSLVKHNVEAISDRSRLKNIINY